MIFTSYRPSFFLKDIIETNNDIISEAIAKTEWIQERGKKCWRFISWDGDVVELSLGSIGMDSEGKPAQYFILKGINCINFCDVIFIAMRARMLMGGITPVSEEDDHKSLTHVFYFTHKGIPENCGEFGEKISS